MKKGQILEGKIEKVNFPNKGIAVVEGEEKTVVVKNTVEGQKVSFAVNKMRKGKAEGRLLEVVEKSPLEIESPCPHFGMCGGCTYQTLEYKTESDIKKEMMKKLYENLYTEELYFHPLEKVIIRYPSLRLLF